MIISIKNEIVKSLLKFMNSETFITTSQSIYQIKTTKPFHLKKLFPSIEYNQSF
jgi:hypothetical protein